ncbi:MAG: hypothetical protein HXM21_00095 [Haemophilus influenzae]|nr:hypothetical protein [Haemophilus influenzae]
MSLMSLLFGTKTSIGSLELDALLTESTTLSSQVTEYPIEDGSVISDHITQENETLSIEGVITSAGTLFNLNFGKAKLIAAKETLRQLHRERALITIVTGLDVYTDFAIESCEISRTAEEGERYSVSISLRKIKKVSLRTEEIPPEKTSGRATGKAGKTKQNAGKQAGNAANQSANSASAEKAKNSFGNSTLGKLTGNTR